MLKRVTYAILFTASFAFSSLGHASENSDLYLICDKYHANWGSSLGDAKEGFIVLERSPDGAVSSAKFGVTPVDITYNPKGFDAEPEYCGGDRKFSCNSFSFQKLENSFEMTVLEDFTVTKEDWTGALAVYSLPLESTENSYYKKRREGMGISTQFHNFSINRTTLRAEIEWLTTTMAFNNRGSRGWKGDCKSVTKSDFKEAITASVNKHWKKGVKNGKKRLKQLEKMKKKNEVNPKI